MQLLSFSYRIMHLQLPYNYFLWLKAFHIIAVICWMAGLLYLPRIFVYHSSVQLRDTAYGIFLTMERRLFLYIMQPSMYLVLGSGIMLSLCTEWPIARYLKVALALGLVLYHHWLWWLHRAFAAKANKYSGGFFRIINEIPTVIMIAIVILVVVKPNF